MSTLTNIHEIQNRKDLITEQKSRGIAVTKSTVIKESFPDGLTLNDKKYSVNLIEGGIWIPELDWKIINPPILVQDDEGDIVQINSLTKKETRYRVDPVQSVINLITEFVESKGISK